MVMQKLAAKEELSEGSLDDEPLNTGQNAVQNKCKNKMEFIKDISEMDNYPEVKPGMVEVTRLKAAT